MKQIRTNSNNNTYSFCKGDVVFEINSKKVNGAAAATVNGQVGKLLFKFLSMMFTNGVIGGWEMCTEEKDGTINAFCINNVHSKNSVDGLVKIIKDGLNTYIVGKGGEAGKFITDVYQLI